MKENFWGKMSDEYLKENPEPPPLADDVLAKFEERVGLKLPKSLTDLLRIKNGGTLQNSDFRFYGREYQVTDIFAVTAVDAWDSIKVYQDVLSDPDSVDEREVLRKKLGDLTKLLLVAWAAGYPYVFVLNYNQRNDENEATVHYIRRELGEEPRAFQLADSFTEFLAGQYFGDAEPVIDYSEADRYRLIAEGGYEGQYEGEEATESETVRGLPVKVQWKICSHWSRLIVFQKIDWAGQAELRREVIHKSALSLEFPELEEYGVELEPELAEMIRPAVEVNIISQSEIPVIPKIWELLLHIQVGHEKWVESKTASPYQGRWKNSSAHVLYASIKSASRAEVTNTLRLVAASCSGLRRWLG